MTSPHPKGGKKLFQKGQTKAPGSGRKPGQKSRVTILLQETILLAAANVGADGKGKGELLGYLESAARRYPKQYLGLIAKVMPTKFEGTVNKNHTFGTKEEVVDELKRRGLPVPQMLIPQKILEIAAKPQVVTDSKMVNLDKKLNKK